MLDFKIKIEDPEVQHIFKALNKPLPTSGIINIPAKPDLLEDLLFTARLHCISGEELYFLQNPTNVTSPFNLRNEAAAVSLILQKLNQSDTLEAQQLRNALNTHCQTLFPQFTSSETVLLQPKNPSTPSITTFSEGTPEAAFHHWAAERGIQAAIQIADFDGLRGCAASTDISPNQPILSIPQAVLLYEDTIKETDLGRMLLAIPNVTVDNVLILYSMLDRHFEDSEWAPFWQSLPTAFRTGLSFPPELIELLHGTAAEMEVQRGQTHLKAQYEVTRPLMMMLLKAYPQFLEADWFSYENYLWAAELFYGYAFDIEFPPSTTSKTVMVPFACHVNHSPWPHVVRYGRFDPERKTLEYPAFRPCPQNHQVFISYGPVPNLKLLTYYGFVIPENPHDVFALQLELPETTTTNELDPQQQQQNAVLQKLSLTLEHSLQRGPFARKLLATLRVIVATQEELQDIESGKLQPLEGMLNIDNERQAVETLKVALTGLLAQIPSSLDTHIDVVVGSGISGIGEEWRGAVECCRGYVRGQRQILEHALNECETLLEGLS